MISLHRDLVERLHRRHRRALSRSLGICRQVQVWVDGELVSRYEEVGNHIFHIWKLTR